MPHIGKAITRKGRAPNKDVYDWPMDWYIPDKLHAWPKRRVLIHMNPSTAAEVTETMYGKIARDIQVARAEYANADLKPLDFLIYIALEYKKLLDDTSVLEARKDGYRKELRMIAEQFAAYDAALARAGALKDSMPFAELYAKIKEGVDNDEVYDDMDIDNIHRTSQDLAIDDYQDDNLDEGLDGEEIDNGKAATELPPLSISP